MSTLDHLLARGYGEGWRELAVLGGSVLGTWPGDMLPSGDQCLGTWPGDMLPMQIMWRHGHSDLPAGLLSIFLAS